MTGLLVACVVLLTLIVLTLVVGFALIGRRLETTLRETEETLRAGREDVSAVSRDIRQSLAEADGLVRSTREQVARVDRVLAGVERLVEGKAVVDAAGRAVNSSRATLLSAIEGVKQGLKTLRSAKSKSKEEADDEQ